MIAGVRAVHDRIDGVTSAGQAYRASDPELLDWVQATASYGFLNAYTTFVRPLPPTARDLYYAEGEQAALLFGGAQPPLSETEMEASVAAMLPRLEPSPVIFEFLEIMRGARILPPVARPAQRLMLKAAVDVLPASVRILLGLGKEWRLRSWERLAVRQAGMAADRLRLGGSPPAQASIRLGLPADYPWSAATFASISRRTRGCRG